MKDILPATIYFIGLSSLAYVIARGFIFAEAKLIVISLFKNHRKLESYAVEFLYCPMCIGFWTGIVSEFFLEFLTWDFGHAAPLFAGAITSVLAMVIDRILNPVKAEE